VFAGGVDRLAEFQRELGLMRYRFQFVTLAGTCEVLAGASARVVESRSHSSCSGVKAGPLP